MQISDFESDLIDEEILDRGRDYFAMEKVGGLRHIDDKTITAKVEGSRTYNVKVSIGGDEIMSWSCSCPYDLGDICKHVVAVLFALKEVKTNSDSQSNNQPEQINIDEIISTLSRDELVDIVKQKAESDELLVARLQARLGGDDLTKVKKSFKRIIRASVAQVKRRGGIQYGDTYDAVEGAREIFDECMQDEIVNPERAITGYESIIEELAPAVNYSDDSDGDIGDLIRGSFDRLNICVKETLSEKVKTEFFRYLIDESQKDIYQEWDWPWEFLRVASELADLSQEQSLIDTANKIVEMAGERRKNRGVEFPSYAAKTSESSAGSFIDRYDQERVAEIELRLVERLHGGMDIDSFLMNHRHLYNMREKETGRLIMRANYETARSIAEEGIEQAIKEKYPGLVNTFRKYLLTIAEKTKDVKSICSLAKILYLDNHQHEVGYYELLKKYTDIGKWPVIRKSIIKDLDTDWDRARLFEYEKSWDDLAKLVEVTASLATYYEKQLIKSHKSVIVKAYIKLVGEGMDYPGGRAQYQEKCQMLGKLKKYGADNKVNEIIADWQKRYERRRALMEELEKL